MATVFVFRHVKLFDVGPPIFLRNQFYWLHILLEIVLKGIQLQRRQVIT